jgi:hypothetical protein
MADNLLILAWNKNYLITPINTLHCHHIAELLFILALNNNNSLTPTPLYLLLRTLKILIRWTTKIPPCRDSSEIQRKHHKRRNIDIPNTQIHDRSLSRFDTSTSIRIPHLASNNNQSLEMLLFSCVYMSCLRNNEIT